MASLQKLTLLCPKNQLKQFVRYRFGVGKHKKPRWFGPAPSKMFKLPPIDHTDPDDVAQQLSLNWEHRVRISAISEFLYEEEIKHSAAGEAAKQEARKEAEADEHLLEENEIINKEIAKKRELRLKQEEKETEERIKQRLENYEKRKYERQRNMEEFIQHETKAMENRIDLKDLEKAIEKALDEPQDYEFAIDVSGHIYRGRETKSIAVPVEEREKIPRPLKEHEKLLKAQ